MKSALLFFSYVVTFLLTTYKATSQVRDKPGIYNSKKEVLKDYAFCQCIIYAFEKDSIELNDASISVLNDLSEYTIALHEKKQMDSLARSYAYAIKPLQQSDYANKKAILLRCIDFYKGAALAGFIKRLH